MRTATRALPPSFPRPTRDTDDRRAAERPRSAAGTFRSSGRHSLTLDIGRLPARVLDRNQALELNAALEVVPERLVVALLAPFYVEIRTGEDVEFLRSAVATFLRECTVEDGHDRVRDFTKRLM